MDAASTYIVLQCGLIIITNGQSNEMALANTTFKQHPRWLYTWTSPDGNTRNQIDYISIVHRWKTSLMNCGTYPGADCDTDHQLLVATVKVRLAKRQRQHSIPPLNLEELKEEKAVQFAAEVSNRFTALEAAHDEVTPEDLWKGTKTVVLEVAREAIGSSDKRLHSRHTWTVFPILYNGSPLSPENCPFPWRIWPPSNTWFLKPT